METELLLIIIVFLFFVTTASLSSSDMSSTLVGIDEDLHHANESLASLQSQVIDAYEQNDVNLGRHLEEQLELMTQERDRLLETKTFIVAKERLQDSSGTLSSVVYLSQMSETFNNVNDDLPKLVFAAKAKNELVGITGVLYVLRGWFASYLEGSEPAIEKLIRKLKSDPRHCRFRIVSRTKDVPNITRRFPNSGLMVKHIETPQSVSQQNPEATMLFELSTHLKLQAFVPRLDSSVLRGRTFNSDQQVGKALQLKRYVVALRPYPSFFTTVSDPLDQAAVIERVMALVRTCVEDSGNSLCQGAIPSPHSSEGVVFVFQTEVGTEVSDRVAQLFETIRRYPETAVYCPVMAVEYGEITSVMNGAVSLVGPLLRSLRLHVELALQRGYGIVFSEMVSNEVGRERCVSLESSELQPRKVMEIFSPTLMASFRWPQEIQRLQKEADDEARRKQSLQLVASISAMGDDAKARTLDSSLRGPFPRATKHAVDLTSEDANRKPISGFPSEEAMRSLYTSFGIQSNGLVRRCDFDAWLHTQENAGVPVYNSEVDRTLSQYDAVGSEFLSFDQFCMLAYARLK